MTETLTVAQPTDPLPATAFEDLYRSSAGDVYAYVASLLHDRAAAEEVTALAFERAFRRRHLYRARRGTARQWLFGIARNAALDELRRVSRQASLTGDLVDDPVPDPEESVEHSLRRAALSGAIRGLAPADRELVALKFFAGLSNREIAGVLRISESNAGSRLHRVLVDLREQCSVTQ